MDEEIDKHFLVQKGFLFDSDKPLEDLGDISTVE
jgi:hypothetical protein